MQRSCQKSAITSHSQTATRLQSHAHCSHMAVCIRRDRVVKLLAQLRMGSHSLAIETGRWIRPQLASAESPTCAEGMPALQ